MREKDNLAQSIIFGMSIPHPLRRDCRTRDAVFQSRPHVGLAMYARHDIVPQSILYADGGARSDGGWKKLRLAMRFSARRPAPAESVSGAHARAGLANACAKR
jgi:hypothetical protein